MCLIIHLKNCRWLPTVELCEIRSVLDPGRGGIYVAHRTSRAHLDQDTKIPGGHHPVLEVFTGSNETGKTGKCSNWHSTGEQSSSDIHKWHR